MTKRPTTEELRRQFPLQEVARRLGLGEFPTKDEVIESPLRPGDKNPSFSVFCRAGRWWWKDHATGEGGDEFALMQLVRGCSFKDAVAEMLGWSGWVEPEKTTRAKTASGENLHHVCTYVYSDESGTVVFEKWRMRKENGGKTFFWRKPAAQGETFEGKKAKRDREGTWWIWSKGACMPVLYRLHELVSAPLPETIYIVEGEKDADNAARALGWVTTTAPDGAKSWRPEFNAFFAGRRVVIVPDNDTAGRDYARKVLGELKGIAAHLGVLDLRKLWPEIPDKADVTDYLEWKKGNEVKA
jgi:putative DNA primase/helicase